MEEYKYARQTDSYLGRRGKKFLRVDKLKKANKRKKKIQNAQQPKSKRDNFFSSLIYHY